MIDWIQIGRQLGKLTGENEAFLISYGIVAFIGCRRSNSCAAAIRDIVGIDSSRSILMWISEKSGCLGATNHGDSAEMLIAHLTRVVPSNKRKRGEKSIRLYQWLSIHSQPEVVTVKGFRPKVKMILNERIHKTILNLALVILYGTRMSGYLIIPS